MRPSYDAEHPHSTTPIYDELYSEYRRLFRALPGDRSGEEDLRFTGFAVRDAAPARIDPRPYPPQHQAFQTYAGQAVGIPQFMPIRPNGPEHTGPADHPFGHTGHPAHPRPHPHDPGQGQGQGQGHGHTNESAGPYATGFHPTPAPGRPPVAQEGTGQGWVAAGYLGAAPPPVAAHVPAPAPVTVPVPAPAPPAGTSSGGRHRSLLSLPPGGGDRR
ncbi:hypothetical protein [Kitasatospora sp. NPDC008115]|uniref:hypothetical protein n=1 Tax=Kitasatospora sp. NPDC008115 TaxID=3364022 RepID=UPI0036E5BE18